MSDHDTSDTTTTEVPAGDTTIDVEALADEEGTVYLWRVPEEMVGEDIEQLAEEVSHRFDNAFQLFAPADLDVEDVTDQVDVVEVANGNDTTADGESPDVERVAKNLIFAAQGCDYEAQQCRDPDVVRRPADRYSSYRGSAFRQRKMAREKLREGRR